MSCCHQQIVSLFCVLLLSTLSLAWSVFQHDNANKWKMCVGCAILGYMDMLIILSALSGFIHMWWFLFLWILMSQGQKEHSLENTRQFLQDKAITRCYFYKTAHTGCQYDAQTEIYIYIFPFVSTQPLSALESVEPSKKRFIKTLFCFKI